MADKKLLRAGGNWVEGDKFWDRKAEIELFIGYIDEGSIQEDRRKVCLSAYRP